MEGSMRARFILFTLSFAFILAALGCTSKPSTNNPNTAGDASTSNPAPDANQNTQRAEAPKPPLVVPSGTAVTVRLTSALGSKLSQPGETFTGSVERNIVVNNVVAIPKGASVSGTVVDAKPLGRCTAGAVLAVRLERINVNGSDLPVRASARSFSLKGKGKRTAVLAGGGAALGGIIGGLAGGGKGAAIGLAAGGGGGGGGAAFTGNKEVVLPAESAV